MAPCLQRTKDKSARCLSNAWDQPKQTEDSPLSRQSLGCDLSAPLMQSISSSLFFDVAVMEEVAGGHLTGRDVQLMA